MGYAVRQNEFNDGTIPNEAKFEGEFDNIYNTLNGTNLADLGVNGNIKIKSASGNVQDANSNELIKFTQTASAVNEITIGNSATGNAPTITASGGDTNVGLTLSPKGSGSVTIGSLYASAAMLSAPNIGSSVVVIGNSQHISSTSTGAINIYDFTSYCTGYDYCTAFVLLRGHGYGDNTSWKIISCNIDNGTVAKISVVAQSGIVGNGNGAFTASGYKLQGTWSGNGGTMVWDALAIILRSN